MKHILITLFTIMLLACGGAEERKAAYLEKARVSIEAGDFDKARIELKNVLQIDPKDVEAVFQLGIVYEQMKDYQKAFGNFARAAELESKNTEYQAKLGTYYLLMGENEKTREIINLINENDPSNIDKDVLNVSLFVREGKNNEALSLAKELMSRNPGQLKPVLLLAQLHKKQTDYDAALILLNEASQLEPGDASIKKEIVSVHMLLRNYKNAEIVMKEIIKLEPDNYKNRTLLAILYKAMGDTDTAEKVLRDALLLEDSGMTGKLTLVSYINEMRGAAAAENELKSMIKNSDKGELNSLRMALAKMHHDAKDQSKEIALYNEIIASRDESSTGMNARINLCKVYIGNNDMEKAVKTINDALTISPNDADALILRSKLSLSKDDTERAIIDLRLAIKERPEEIEAYALLIGAHMKNNETDKINEILNDAYDNNLYNATSLLELADLNIKLKNIAGAEKAIDAAIRNDANNLSALVLKTKILNTKKDFEKARVIAKQIIDMHPDKPDGYMLITPSMLNLGQADELYTLINDGYNKTNYDSRLLEVLVAINSGQKKYDVAIKLLESEIDKRGKSAALYRMLAKVYDASGKIDDAVATFRKALEAKNDWTELYTELANVLLRSNDIAAAESLLKEGKSLMPKDGEIGMSLAVLYEKTKQPGKAIREYEDLLSYNPDNVVIINNLVSLMSDHQSDDAGIKRALELSEKLKDSKQPAILDTVGWVYYKAGMFSDAVRVLESVVSASPDIPVFDYHLGMALYRNGDEDSAKTYLSKSLSREGGFTGRDEAEALMKKLQ